VSGPILVVGATGVLGRMICARLRDAGHPVRALLREGSSGRDWLTDLGCDLVRGDLLDPPSLTRACEGVAQVVNTATSIATLRRGQSMKAIDQDGLLALVAAAETVGVSHFVFISLPATTENIRFVGYKRSVERALRESTMQTTILQPGAFMESSFNPAHGWDVRSGTVKIVGDGQAKTTFVSARDVAKAAVAVLENPELQGGDWPIGGPELLSARDAVAIYEEVFGTRVRVRSVPRWLVRGLSMVVMPWREDLASVMAILSTDMAGVAVKTPPELLAHIEPMVKVREFAETQSDATAGSGIAHSE
jgi:uncharacterized protein YbjT (DUF2867 family)